MSNGPVLHLLGLAKKAGRLEIGEEPVGAACRARQARLMLLAGDAAPNARRRCAHYGEIGDVLWLEVPFEKGELGAVLGRSSCAMLALTDAGFAAAVTEKLAAQDPERYGPAAQQLREKADRVFQRQKEQRQHEKNLQRRKKAPWAPPPPPRSKEEAPPQRSRSKTVKARRRPQDGPGRTQIPGRTDRDGPVRPKGTAQKPGPSGRRLTGRFRKP